MVLVEAIAILSYVAQHAHCSNETPNCKPAKGNKDMRSNEQEREKEKNPKDLTISTSEQWSNEKTNNIRRYKRVCRELRTMHRKNQETIDWTELERSEMTENAKLITLSSSRNRRAEGKIWSPQWRVRSISWLVCTATWTGLKVLCHGRTLLAFAENGNCDEYRTYISKSVV